MNRYFFIQFLALLIILDATVLLAGTKTIRPHELNVSSPDNSYYRTPATFNARTNLSSASAYAFIKLPKGKNFKELKYLHSGTGDPADPVFTFVQLWMVNRDTLEETKVAYAESTLKTTGYITVEASQNMIHKIRKGYDYFVEVYSANLWSKTGNISVIYK